MRRVLVPRSITESAWAAGNVVQTLVGSRGKKSAGVLIHERAALGRWQFTHSPRDHPKQPARVKPTATRIDATASYPATSSR
jgi:hypothetical protein